MIYFQQGNTKPKFTVMPIKKYQGSGFSYSSFHQEGGMFGPGNPYEFNFPLMPRFDKKITGGKKKRNQKRKGRK